ncbi:uncharacterized protein A1O9_07323 [Exophiala aquamarina CBS 119918]|uniref:Fungal N-terminal domain-containing protein n=1 Tax=Exophiala aquamarina CBS 119918 TaxID=1182545 RepID=A0A072PCW5_9EURO|nr:uncharacterized protein A1O9_07323 [Exophiala aquamarina CBS 119918]KEF57133.1 hypothetical protein A1O9_07323 [Exophiala aquamarina CBS 119918]
MAEVLGIVAGGAGLASLAIQILDDVQKIRELYNAIRDAPSEFQSLLDEIQLLSMVVSLFARESAQLKSDHEIAVAQSQIVRHCQGIHDELRPILAQLTNSLVSRKRSVSWISVKSVFQRRKIDQMLMKLERAKSTLVLARLLNITHSPPPKQSCEHTVATPSPFQKPNICRLNSDVKSMPAISRSSYSLGLGRLTVSHGKPRSDEEGDAVTARFAFAPWVLDWAITTTFRKHNGILNISLQPKCLGKHRLPTPLWDGTTPLAVLIIYKVAAAWRQPEICRKLIDLGADISALLDEEDEYIDRTRYWNPLTLACKSRLPRSIIEGLCRDQTGLAEIYTNRRFNVNNQRDTLRVLVEDGNAEIEQPAGRFGLVPHYTALHWFSGPLDTFCWLSAEDKITLIGADLQEFYLSVAIINPIQGVEFFKAAVSKHLSLRQLDSAHWFHMRFPESFVFRVVYEKLTEDEQQDLVDTMRLSLNAGIDFHNSGCPVHTPLTARFHHSIDWYIRYELSGVIDCSSWSFSSIAAPYTKRLKRWADLLEQAGQDLDEYVRVDKERGLNKWIQCRTGLLDRSNDDYLANLMVLVRVFLGVNSKEERLRIRVVYATKKRCISIPGEWVQEQSHEESSSEDDEGWTFHYPSVDDDISEYDYDEDENDSESESESESKSEDDDDDDDDRGGTERSQLRTDGEELVIRTAAS